jgi:hypothetical protein
MAVSIIQLLDMRDLVSHQPSHRPLDLAIFGQHCDRLEWCEQAWLLKNSIFPETA